MAKPKKGALMQLLVPMVDSTDFASIESGITESDFNSGATKKFYGVNHGGSAATTSGTISKTASLVRSGVFRITLKGTENNYDLMQIRVAKTGCAEQIYEWENMDYDDSDIYSMLVAASDAISNAYSAAVQCNSRALQTRSDVSDTLSKLIVMSGIQSDIYSAIVANNSDFQSRVPTIVATRSLLSDVQSNLLSYLLGMSGVLSDTYSQLSDFRSNLHSFVSTTGVNLHTSALSDLGSRVWAHGTRTLTSAAAATVTASDISDIASAVWANTIGARVDSRVLLNLSRISDVQSALAAGVGLNASDMSDLRSAIAAGPAATVTASDISDIASAVWANVIGARVDSRVLINMSRISDIYSALSDALSGPMTASDLSDIASAVWAHVIGARVDSRVLLNQSRISDIQSLLTVANSDISDIKSALTAGVSVSASDMSDIRSAITAATYTLSASDISDVASAVWANTIGARVDSRLRLVQSDVSDVKSAITAGVSISASDLSDLRSAINAVGVNASSISDIASAVRATLDSDLSDLLSRTTQINSRVALVQSGVSDVESAVDSQFAAGQALNASTMSDLRSAITAVTLSASDISDIASAVWATAGADPTAVVAATGTMAAKLNWLTALSRNAITQTATVQSLRNDANNADIASAAVADDGATFTRGEFA